MSFGGKLDILGKVGTTGAVVLVQGITNAPPFYNETNWLGGAVVHAGSNRIPIVARTGTNRTEMNRSVFLPPTNPEQFTYDLNGNMTADGFCTYEWNQQGLLATIETATNHPGMTRTRSEFLYDGAGRRVRTTRYSSWDGSSYAVMNVTRFLYDNRNMLAELNEYNQVTSYHVWGLDINQSLQAASGIAGLLARLDFGGTTNSYLYFYDGNGNVTDIADIGGNVAAQYSYSPFGETIAQSGPYSSNNPWRFSTRRMESGWNLYYYHLRYYNPNVTRWLSRDPIEYRYPPDGPNPYGLVGNQPIMHIDPLGGFTTKPSYLRCCGAAIFDPLTECCCLSGTVVPGGSANIMAAPVKKAPVDTTVRINEVNKTGTNLPGDWENHFYVQWDTGSIDYNWSGSASWSTPAGVVNFMRDNPNWRTMVSSPGPVAMPQPTTVSPCSYDINSLKRCLNSRVTKAGTTVPAPSDYSECQSAASAIVNACYGDATPGCTMPTTPWSGWPLTP